MELQVEKFTYQDMVYMDNLIKMVKKLFKEMDVDESMVDRVNGLITTMKQHASWIKKQRRDGRNEKNYANIVLFLKSSIQTLKKIYTDTVSGKNLKFTYNYREDCISEKIAAIRNIYSRKE